MLILRAFLISYFISFLRIEENKLNPSGEDTYKEMETWSRKWQLTLVFFPGKLGGQRSLVGYSPTRATRGYRVTRATGLQEPDTTEQLSTHKCNFQMTVKVYFSIHLAM